MTKCAVYQLGYGRGNFMDKMFFIAAVPFGAAGPGHTFKFVTEDYLLGFPLTWQEEFEEALSVCTFQEWGT